MRTFSQASSGRQAGYGLLIVMAFMVVLLLVFTSLLLWSSSSAKITVRNNLYNQAENAAESATENIMAYMMRDQYYSSIGAAANYATNFPPTNGWPIYFQFGCTNGDPNAAANYAASVYIGQQSVNATVLSAQYAGLYGFIMPTTIACTATPVGQGQELSATVVQNIQFALIPLFQFAIFYNMDLEINPGDTMNITGPVHSNNSIWASGNSSSQKLTFASHVEAATGVFLQSSTNDPHFSPPRTGNVAFTVSNNNPLNNANILSLPIGLNSSGNTSSNVLAILNLPPATNAPPNYEAAYRGNGSNYLSNQVDLMISNSATGLNTAMGTNLVISYQNPLNSPNYLANILPDVPVVTVTANTSGGKTIYATNINYLYYSFATNVSFYDYREAKTVQAVQLDIAALDKWLTNTIYLGGASLTNPAAGKTNILLNLYGNTITAVALNGTNTISMKGLDITAQIFTNPVTLCGQQYNLLKTTGSTQVSQQGINSIFVLNSVPLKNNQLPAVRLVNGQRLPPSGLTVATPYPIYVKGDYNTTTNGTKFSKTLGDTVNTCPAALMGDSVTVLSGSWQDNYSTAISPSGRTATATTINAATLEGIVPSRAAYYSGGVENFLRLLEDWSGSVSNVYNGSIVVMFPSQFATNGWDATGSYYNPPKRAWGFDPKFSNANNLPPLTPKIKGLIRSGWSTW